MSEFRNSIQNLLPGSRYIIRTRSTNDLGVSSDWSDAYDLELDSDTVTGVVSDPPSNLQLLFTGGDLVVKWTAPAFNADGTEANDLVGYYVEITDQLTNRSVEYFVLSNLFEYNFTLNKYDFTDPIYDVQVSVSALNATGLRSNALADEVTNPVPPDPTSLSLVANFESILVAMSSPVNLTDFKAFILEHSTDAVEWEQIAETSSDVYIHGVSEGTTHYYRYLIKDLFNRVSNNYSSTQSITSGVVSTYINQFLNIDGDTGSTTADSPTDTLTIAGGTHIATTVTGDSVSVDFSIEGDLNLGNNKITNLATPTASTDAATKGYVDGVAQGLDVKESVDVATTAAGTLSSDFENGDTVDGVVLSTGDRILIKDQAVASENGIYTVNASGAPTRAVDFNEDAEVTAGAFTFVERGTVNADTGWVVVSEDPITVGSSDIDWTQFSDTGTAVGYAVVTYATSIGDGTNTSYTVTHSLNTKDVNVFVYTNAGDQKAVHPEIIVSTVNAVVINFNSAPTTNQYRVVVNAIDSN